MQKFALCKDPLWLLAAHLHRSLAQAPKACTRESVLHNAHSVRLAGYLDKGVSLGAEAPCLTTAGRTLTYFDVQRLSWRIARALDRSGVRPGDKVAILSANDPVAFACVFGISRAGAVWCPVNPRNEAAENRDLLDFFDCTCLITQAAFAPLVPAGHFRDDGSIATERLSSAGRPTPLTTVAIMDDEGHLLGRGERGEIVVRGSLVMAGYYKNPQASAEAARHGWHHTGDIGYLDEDSYLFIVDRAKDMIITGGFNVYSAEVEQVLLAHPAVRDCAVIGLPDEKWGERVTAVLQLRPGHAVTADDVGAFARERLGGVKAPKQVEVWPDLPRSKVGKVLKPEIKARLRASETP